VTKFDTYDDLEAPSVADIWVQNPWLESVCRFVIPWWTPCFYSRFCCFYKT